MSESALSHDLVEGNLLRSALGSDIVLSDSTPKNALSDHTRLHRWFRGDLQVMPYLAKTVCNTEGKRIRNPMSRLSKFKIFDNFLRGLTPLFALLSVLLAFAFGIRTCGVVPHFLLFCISFLRSSRSFSPASLSPQSRNGGKTFLFRHAAALP